MRIALLHYSYAPILGGVEIVMAAHARIFKEAGHEVVVFCQRGNANGESVRMLPQDISEPDLTVALEGFDMVIVHNVMTMPFDPGLTASLWTLSARTPRTKFISWIHDLAALNPDYKFDRKADPWHLLSTAAPDFEHVTISPHRAAQFAALTGVTPQAIPNGIDPAAMLRLTPAIDALMDAGALWRRDVLLLHPARFVRRKNIELGLEVTAALRRNRIDAALLVTGADDAQNASAETYREELCDHRCRLSLEGHVFFLSERFTVTSEDLVSLYDVADALFFPSRQEGFGLPLLEAALHRIPIFCLDAPPVNTLLEHRPHCFPITAEPMEIAQYVIATLAQDPAHQARRSVLNQSTWQVISDQFLKPFLQAHIPHL